MQRVSTWWLASTCLPAKARSISTNHQCHWSYPRANQIEINLACKHHNFSSWQEAFPVIARGHNYSLPHDTSVNYIYAPCMNWCNCSEGPYYLLISSVFVTRTTTATYTCSFVWSLHLPSCVQARNLFPAATHACNQTPKSVKHICVVQLMLVNSYLAAIWWL
jgi:hypothetical protein